MVVLIALMPVLACSQTTEAEKSDAVLLADGTPIHLVLMDDLQGKKLQVKQTVHFQGAARGPRRGFQAHCENRRRGNRTH